MRLRTLPLGALITLALLAPTTTRADIKPVATIVAQPAAPVVITSYQTSYESRQTQFIQRGIQHGLKYQNRGAKELVAVEFGLVSFDLWNEFLDRTSGLTTSNVAPGKDASASWAATAYGDFAFMTGVVYVNRVRFSDGEIWTADRTEVVDAMRKIQSNFEADKLTTPERPDQ